LGKNQADKLNEIDPVNGKKRLSYFLSFYSLAALLNAGVADAAKTN